MVLKLPSLRHQAAIELQPLLLQVLRVEIEGVVVLHNDVPKIVTHLKSKSNPKMFGVHHIIN